MLFPVITSFIISALIYSQMQLHWSISQQKQEIVQLKQELKLIQQTISPLNEDNEEKLNLKTESISGTISETPIIFDSTGVLQLGISVIVQLFELSRGKAIAAHINEKSYLSFFNYNVPMSSAILWTLSFLLGWSSYFNILSHSSFLLWFTKTLIFWYIGIYFANTINNLIRLYRYLPSSLESFMSKANDRSWWWWLVSRTFGIDSIVNGMQLAGFIAMRFLQIWPFLYFFRNAGTSASITSTHAFLVNCIIHSTSIWQLFYIYEITASGVNGAFSRFMLHYDADLANLAGIIIFAYSFLLTILRVIWLFFHGGCTLWGSLFIAPLILIVQALFIFSCIPIMLALPLKKEYYVKFLQKLHSDEVKATLLQEHETEEEADAAFCGILDCTTRMFVFNRIRRGAENDEKPEVDGETFDRLFQIAFFMMRASSGVNKDEDEIWKDGGVETEANGMQKGEEEENLEPPSDSSCKED